MICVTVCRHCQKAKVSRPRGLCWIVLLSAGLAGSVSRRPASSSTEASATSTSRRPPPPIPTSRSARFARKTGRARRAARLKQALWHPDDAPGKRAKCMELEMAG